MSDFDWRKDFPLFMHKVMKRLEKGEREYGNRSFRKPTRKLVKEVEEELLDVLGWAFIIWGRMNEYPWAKRKYRK